jgi:hypothetical protein
MWFRRFLENNGLQYIQTTLKNGESNDQEVNLRTNRVVRAMVDAEASSNADGYHRDVTLAGQWAVQIDGS